MLIIYLLFFFLLLFLFQFSTSEQRQIYKNCKHTNETKVGSFDYLTVFFSFFSISSVLRVFSLVSSSFRNFTHFCLLNFRFFNSLTFQYFRARLLLMNPAFIVIFILYIYAYVQLYIEIWVFRKFFSRKNLFIYFICYLCTSSA